MFSSKCTDEYFLIIVLKQLVLSVQLISQEFLTIDEVAHSYEHRHCESYKNLWLLERTQTWCTTPNVTAAKCTKNKITRIITGQMTSVYWWCHSSSALFHLIWITCTRLFIWWGGVAGVWKVTQQCFCVRFHAQYPYSHKVRFEFKF